MATQAEITSLKGSPWDVIVVGAGPAGAACAIVSAHTGHRTLLLERAVFPRDKACGGMLLSDAASELEYLGVLAKVKQAAYSFSTARIYSTSQTAFDIPGRYMSLRRSELDGITATAAVSAGAEFVRGDVTKITETAGGSVQVTLRGQAEPLKAHYCVIATGAAVHLGRSLGMIARPAASAFAVRGYIKSTYEIPEAIFYFEHALIPGYFWILPYGGGLYNVGCGAEMGRDGKVPIDLKAKLSQLLRDFEPAARLMAQGEKCSPVSGAPIRYGMTGNTECTKGPILSTGEAIAATYPLTCEGISNALVTGQMAGRAVSSALESGDRKPLYEYARLLESEMKPRYRSYALGQSWLGRSWLNDLIARRVKSSTFLRRRFESLADQTEEPSSIFCVRSLFLSLFR